MINATLQPLYPWAKDTVHIVQEAGWAPGSVWTGVENLTPAGIRSPGLAACSQSKMYYYYYYYYDY